MLSCFFFFDWCQLLQAHFLMTSTTLSPHADRPTQRLRWWCKWVVNFTIWQNPHKAQNLTPPPPPIPKVEAKILSCPRHITSLLSRIAREVVVKFPSYTHCRTSFIDQLKSMNDWHPKSTSTTIDCQISSLVAQINKLMWEKHVKLFFFLWLVSTLTSTFPNDLNDSFSPCRLPHPTTKMVVQMSGQLHNLTKST